MAEWIRILFPTILLGLSAPVSAQDQASESGPPWSQADEYWDPEEMEQSRHQTMHEMGGMPTGFIMADRLEFQGGHEDRWLWDAQGWYGGDRNRLWLKTEGKYSTDESAFKEAELQVLWSRPISPFWDLQAGARYDFEPDGLAHAVIGLQGLAPYWWETDAALFISQDGNLTARVEGEYDLRITQRLILQPRGELGFSASDVPELGVGSGFTELALGLRLRYEVIREAAPYIGIEWQRAFGKTADFIDATGGDSSDVVVIAGIRTWF